MEHLLPLGREAPFAPAPMASGFLPRGFLRVTSSWAVWLLILGLQLRLELAFGMALRNCGTAASPRAQAAEGGNEGDHCPSFLLARAYTPGGV